PKPFDVLSNVERHEALFPEPRELLARHPVHASGRAATADLYVVEDDRGLNERLQEQLLARAAVVAPALLPGVVRRVELARVVEVYTREVLPRVAGGVLLRVSVHKKKY